MKLHHSDEYIAVLQSRLVVKRRGSNFWTLCRRFAWFDVGSRTWFGRYFTFIVDRFSFIFLASKQIYICKCEQKKLLKLLCPPFCGAPDGEEHWLRRLVCVNETCRKLCEIGIAMKIVENLGILVMKVSSYDLSVVQFSFKDWKFE